MSTTARATTRATPQTYGIIGDLNLEWAKLQDAAPSWLATMTNPQHHEQPRTLNDVLTVITTADRPTVDHTLHTLLAHAAAGQDLAARTVLQAMLPKCVRLARSARKHGVDAAQEAVLAAMWAAIQQYPLHRHTSVAASLALATLKEVRSRARDTRHQPSTVLSWDAMAYEPNTPSPATASENNERAVREVIELLGWAHQAGILNKLDLQILGRMHLSDDADSLTLRALADELGFQPAMIRQRYSRAIRRLQATVRTTTAAA